MRDMTTQNTQKTKHTPGPWHVSAASVNGRRDHAIYSDKDNRTYVASLVHRDGLSNEEIDANAALIVQAVNSHADLLGVARHLATLHGGELYYGNKSIRALVDMAQAAIAKAKGGAA